MNVKFTLTIDGVNDDSLSVREFEGLETLSNTPFEEHHAHGFCLHIAFASRQSTLNEDDVVDKHAELHIYQNNELTQRFHGVVSQFTQGDTGRTHRFYHITLVPALMRLSLRKNSRLFQNLSAPDIIATLLVEMGINNYAFSLSRTCAMRELCVQYRESDLAFIERLSAEEGMVYSIEHEAGKHTVVFSDRSELHPKLPAPVSYHNQAGGQAGHSYIRSLHSHTQIAPSHVTLKDYSFKNPRYSQQHTQLGQHIQYQRDTYEHFDAPGRYKDEDNGKAFTNHRLGMLRRDAHTVTGKGNHAPLRAGVRFTLESHPSSELNRDWLVVSVYHTGTQPQALEEAATSGQTTYHNHFKLLSSKHTWRATINPKPQVDGPMVAMVVGPQGEEIHCDEHGRVKVHFTWDRYSNADEHSSCWVRVSQAWAGSQYGVQALPRIGHEVIVSFLNGDPDQPIITGTVHNAVNLPAYTLPEHKTKTVLRSQTHQGKGFNELSFEDQADSEKIYLHAQKDLESKVRHDHINDIGHDAHLLVGNDQFNQIKGTHHHSVDGASRIKIGQDASSIVDGSVQQRVGREYVLDVKEQVHIKAGRSVVIEAGSKLSLKVGGAFISVDAAGVCLSGTAVNLNQGGSALSVSSFTGEMPALPFELPAQELATPPLPKQLDIQKLRELAMTNISMSKLCGRQSNGQCSRDDCECERAKESENA